MTRLYRNLRIGPRLVYAAINGLLLWWVVFHEGPYAWWAPAVGLIAGVALAFVESRAIEEARDSLSGAQSAKDMWAAIDRTGAGKFAHRATTAIRVVMYVSFAVMAVDLLRLLNKDAAVQDTLSRVMFVWWSVLAAWCAYGLALNLALIPALRGLATADETGTRENAT